MTSLTDLVLTTRERRRLALATAADEAGDVRGKAHLLRLERDIADRQDNDDTARFVAWRSLREAMDVDGATVRVSTASGILHAYSRGLLDGLRYPAGSLRDVAEMYRGCFEATHAMLTPDRNEVSGGGAGGVQERVVQCGAILAILRRDQKPQMVRVLDQVCGWDKTCAAVAAEWSIDHRIIKRQLREGIEMSARNWFGREKYRDPS
jgi:hypothetical protein